MKVQAKIFCYLTFMTVHTFMSILHLGFLISTIQNSSHPLIISWTLQAWTNPRSTHTRLDYCGSQGYCGSKKSIELPSGRSHSALQDDIAVAPPCMEQGTRSSVPLRARGLKSHSIPLSLDSCWSPSPGSDRKSVV